jgi:hypothetical protein
MLHKNGNSGILLHECIIQGDSTEDDAVSGVDTLVVRIFSVHSVCIVEIFRYTFF